MLYVFIVIVFEKIKNTNSVSHSKKNSRMIDVSDLAQSEEFSPKVVGITRENLTVGLNTQIIESRQQAIPKVTGAVFGQGFEVNKIDRNFRSENGTIFTGVTCS